MTTPSYSEILELLSKLKRVPAHGTTFGFGNGSVKINVEQIFRLVSPITEVNTI